MENAFWNKITNYKIFGKIIFTKEEICSDIQCDGPIYKVTISQDYFDSEFKTDKDEKKKK